MARRPTSRTPQGIEAWLPPKLQPDPSAPREPDGTVRTRAMGRLGVIAMCLGVGFLSLGWKASTLMLQPDHRLEGKAKLQFEKSVQVEGRRGNILDRNGKILATTVDLVAAHADPKRLEGDPIRINAMVDAVAPILDIDPDRLRARLSNPARRDVLLARGLTPAKAAELRRSFREAAKDLDIERSALWTREEPRRFYPSLSDGAPLLGLVGHSGSGLTGLERRFDRQLRGEMYKYVLLRDRKGRRITPETQQVDAGHTFVLTLDRDIQHVAEQALKRAVEITGAEAAFAVVTDVATGDVLALANHPTQNPNDTSLIDLGKLKNRAAMDAFEPGSVIKPFVAAAALHEELVTPDTVIDCEGGRWAVGRSVIGDDHPMRTATVTEVIQNSSNIGAAKLAFKLGAKRTLTYLTDFGFGRKTGLGLPGETRGQMRKPDTIKDIELATTAYGHGMTTNGLQLASAMATLGNGGVRMQPRLVIEVQNSQGEVVERAMPKVDRRVVSEAAARATIAMMEAVTTEGTGQQAAIDGYHVAGKTGTAWKHVDGAYSKTDRIGSFVGLLPADAPTVAIAVVVDTPTIGRSYGGVVAAPVFAEIGAFILRRDGVPVDPAMLKNPPTDEEPDQEATPSGQNPELRWTAAGKLQLPDLTGQSLRDSLVTLQGAGLSIDLEGSGLVAHQIPKPGATIVPGDTISLVLQ